MRNATRRKVKKRNYLINKIKKIMRARNRKSSKSKKNCSRINKDIVTYSKVIEFLKSKKFKLGTKINKGYVEIELPKQFSFSTNPEQTLIVLKKLLSYGVNRSVKEIRFNHSNCQYIGIGASVVMDIILLEVNKMRNLVNLPLDLSGELPPEGDERDLLETSGILKHLGFKEPKKDHIEKLELITCGESGYVSTKVIDFFIRCLKTQKYTLTKYGRSKFSEMVGEVIDNCDQHGGEESKWYTIGHYIRHKDRDYGECRLAIFNFGQTIYESLKSEGTSEEIIDSLNNITRKHIDKGFLTINRWTEENLWTLYALQEGVSRLRYSDNEESKDRGTGTIKLIDRFLSIGKNKEGDLPLMSIISGRTHILFDGTYRLQTIEIGEETRQIITFNKENDLSIPPDEKYVKNLRNSFPGTVITMKFYLDRDYIKRVVEGS